MSVTITADKAAAVDQCYFWRPVGPDTPCGPKVQLINRKAGVATHGTYSPGNKWWTHWAPLPKFP